MNLHRISVLLAACLIGASLGCMSAESTLLQRDESNQTWQRERKLKGVPITLKVPTHIKIDVVEHHFLTLGPAATGEGMANGNGSGEDNRSYRWLRFDKPIRSVKSELIETEKVFTVDPKRPAAGSLDASLKFSGQYFDQIDYDVDDETISDVTNLISKIAKGGLFGTPTSSGQEVDKLVKKIDSHVASAFFELDSPTLELEIQEFLLKHISGCHNCGDPLMGGSPAEFTTPADLGTRFPGQIQNGASNDDILSRESLSGSS